MIRPLLALLALATTLVAADKPTGYSFLQLGGHTQIVAADGQATWSYPAQTRDGWVLPNGHLLLVLSKNKAFPGGAVVEVDRALKVFFEYKGTQAEVNTAQLLENGNIMLTEAGPNPRLLEVTRDGKIAVEIPLHTQLTNPHMQSRMARKLANGNYLVPQDKTVREYNPKGEIIWEAKSPESKDDNRSFAALRLPNGHTLISLTVGSSVIEVDAQGQTVWELSNKDFKEPVINRTTALAVLPNGNIMVSNYAARSPQPKLIEVTRAKQIVWTYTDSLNEGIHEFQLLDEAGRPVAGMLR